MSPKLDVCALGKEVRRRRRAMKMLQEQLEEQIGVDQGTISAIENAKSKDYYCRNILPVCQYLDVDIFKYITKGDGNE